MYARVPPKKLMHCRESLLFLAINRKQLCQTLSSVENSVIVLLFSFLVLIGLTGKSTNYMRRLCGYVKMITPRATNRLLRKQGLVNIHIRNDVKLMIEIFKCLKGLSPHIMNEIFMLRNIPNTIRNSRDLDRQLPQLW